MILSPCLSNRYFSLLNTMSINSPYPWYRELWPWLLIAGPFAVVLASAVTFWLAYSHSDPLVVDDYYKAGKAINMTMKRDAQARSLGLSAEMNAKDGNVSIVMHSHADTPLPPMLRLLVTHATQREKDRTVLLNASLSGHYDGSLRDVDAGRYHLTLEDIERTWRLNGDWRASDESSTVSLRINY
jgi:uncharacterized protein